ncbi:hypothetical protein BKA69DRAFT_898134 [Paraphysoderma sedebokerense]|nr:hypothetical protein BKA69DRAFT_898134 [Paraphysoderma sedebokerense]
MIITGNQFNDYSEYSVFKTGMTNTPPTTFPLNITINEDQAVILELQASDQDPADVVTVHIVNTPINGTLYQLSGNGSRGALIDASVSSIAVTNLLNRVLYIPNPDFYGNDSFNISARDRSNAGSSTVVADITVISIPDPPVPQSHTYQMDEDAELTFTLEIVDPDSPKIDQTVILFSLPTNGVLFTFSAANVGTWDQVMTIPIAFPQNTTFKYSPFQDIHGNDSFNFMVNDGYINSTVNGTILFNVRAVNDPPLLNLSGLNLIVYEDNEALLTFNIFDIDIGDKISVKITNLEIDGSIYFMDIQKGSRVLLGEGSEVKGPPYQVIYIPAPNFYTSTDTSLQQFNITYTDGVDNKWFSHRVSFPVLPVNDPPFLSCSQPQIELPVRFLVGASSNHTFQLEIFDVDDNDLTFFLVSAPLRGVLKTTNNQKLVDGSSFYDRQLVFDGEKSAGGYPYSNFTMYAIDNAKATSNNCTYQFTFTCPPGFFNNIFSNGTGEICKSCPQGAICR